jgi:hypothetical protein
MAFVPWGILYGLFCITFIAVKSKSEMNRSYYPFDATFKPVFVNDVLCVEVWDDGLKCPSNGRPVFDNFFCVFQKQCNGNYKCSSGLSKLTSRQICLAAKLPTEHVSAGNTHHDIRHARASVIQ